MHLWDHMLEYLLFMLRFQGQSTSASLQRMIDSLQKAVGMKYSTWPWLRVLKRTRAASVFLPKSHQTDSAGHNINHSTLTTAPGHKLTVTDQNKSRPTCSVVIPLHTLESWGLSHQTMINALEIIDRLWPPQSRMDIMSFLAIKPQCFVNMPYTRCSEGQSGLSFDVSFMISRRSVNGEPLAQNKIKKTSSCDTKLCPHGPPCLPPARHWNKQTGWG